MDLKGTALVMSALNRMAQVSEQMAGLNESPFISIPIWSLSDDLLSKIFTYLNASDRFRLAEVCSRWAGVSRMDWTDIISLDLSPIPTENVEPIIQLCPKVASISAQNCELNVTSITENLRSELKSLSLYRVSAHAGLLPSAEDTLDGSPNQFLRHLQQLTHLEELVLSELPNANLAECNRFVWDNLPSSLKRLQLNIAVFGRQFLQQDEDEALFETIDCLILQEDSLLPLCVSNFAAAALFDDTAAALFRLRWLHELSLAAFFGNAIAACAADNYICAYFNQLEVLSIQVSNATALSGLVPLLNSHPTLRILIITGAMVADAGEILIPLRRRYPNGLGSDPLPILHVFIGGQIAQKIRFARAPNDALELHPINLPMPQFLEQPEVAAIFKGSWIAEMIKKGAKANARLWDYDTRIAQSVLVFNP